MLLTPPAAQLAQIASEAARSAVVQVQEGVDLEEAVTRATLVALGRTLQLVGAMAVEQEKAEREITCRPSMT